MLGTQGCASNLGTSTPPHLLSPGESVVIRLLFVGFFTLVVVVALALFL